MHRLFTVLFLLLSVTYSHAQHLVGWTRLTLQLPLHEHWSTDAELQSRRQNGLSSINPMQEHLLYSYRHWLYYRVNEGVKFALSPFACYKLYPTLQLPEDYQQQPLTEYRVSGAVELQHPIVANLYITDRTAAEYRMIQHIASILRMRNRLGLMYNLHSRWIFNVQHEVFFNATGTDVQHIFDQDRLHIGASWHITNKLMLGIAYIHISRQDKHLTEKLEEENMMLSMSYRFTKHS